MVELIQCEHRSENAGADPFGSVSPQQRHYDQDREDRPLRDDLREPDADFHLPTMVE